MEIPNSHTSYLDILNSHTSCLEILNNSHASSLELLNYHASSPEILNSHTSSLEIPNFHTSSLKSNKKPNLTSSLLPSSHTSMGSFTHLSPPKICQDRPTLKLHCQAL